MNTHSIDEAKEILRLSPLVKQKILTYSFVPLKDYHFDKSLSTEKSNFVLIYVSAQTRELTSLQLQGILETARKRNPAMQITGMLLYHQGSFLQVLEGERSKVEALFAKIETDSRHNKVAKVTTYFMHDRLFSNWSMGFADLTQDQLASIDGLNDFFKNGNSLANIQEKQAKDILSAFKEGKWRQYIS